MESKRYGTIDFPPGLPRLFSFNSEATIVLSIFGEEPTDAHSRAQLKRVCIDGFGKLVTTPLISDEGKSLQRAHSMRVYKTTSIVSKLGGKAAVLQLLLICSRDLEHSNSWKRLAENKLSPYMACV